MKYLFIAEKPSVMRLVQAVYNKYGIEGSEIDFAAFHGHLMELVMPDAYDPRYKQYRLEDLPIIPDVFLYREKDKESCDKIMAKIKSGHYDAIINACDAEREGEQIFFSFYEAHKLNLPVYRFWTSETEEKALKKALENLLPASNFAGYRAAAKYRATLDWLMGMNFSRVVGLKTGKIGTRIGRVKTPLLGMVVDREDAIKNFVSQDLFEAVATFLSDKGEYEGTYLIPPDSKNTKFKEKGDAEAVLNSTKGMATVVEIKEEKTSKKAPTLYSTTELQKDAQKFGFSPKQTLDILESLYQKQYTSYPRVDVRYIPRSEAKNIPKRVENMRGILAPFVDKITKEHIVEVLSTNDYVDDAPKEAHYAIIPTDKVPDFNDMSNDEQKIYMLIACRLVALFLPPHITSNTVILTECDNGAVFRTTGRTEVQKGYLELYQSKKAAPKAAPAKTSLPNVQKGESVRIQKTFIKESQTTPPARYNIGTLLDAMINAGNQLKDAESRKILRESNGLGTSATRAGIIEELQDGKMIVYDNKKKEYSPTPYGEALIRAIGDNKVVSPQLTADWEKKLLKIQESNQDDPDFKNTIETFIKAETAALIKTVNENLAEFNDQPSAGVCPVCGKPLLKKKNFFVCSCYKNPCTFFVPIHPGGCTITDKDLKAMLNGQPSDEKEWTAKNGKKIKSAFIIKDGKFSPAWVANERKSEALSAESLKTVKTLGNCPNQSCKGKIYESKTCYLCTEKINGCNFNLSKTIKGSTISPENVSLMLEGKLSSPIKFTWASGRSSDAQLSLLKGKLEWHFS